MDDRKLTKKKKQKWSTINKQKMKTKANKVINWQRSKNAAKMAKLALNSNENSTTTNQWKAK